MTLVERLRENDAELFLPILGEAADRIEQIEAQLAERDKFIVSKGLWNEFVDQLPAALGEQS